MRLAAYAVLMVLTGCSADTGPLLRDLRRRDLPSVREGVRQMMTRLHAGLSESAARFGGPTGDLEGAELESAARRKLIELRDARRGVQAVWSSGATFVALLDENGVVIARDAEPDTMRGLNLQTRFAEIGHCDAQPEWVGRIVDSSQPTLLTCAVAGRFRLLAGIALPRLALSVQRQLRLQTADATRAGRVYWVYAQTPDEPGAVWLSEDNPPEFESEVLTQAIYRQPGLRGVSFHSRAYGVATFDVSGPNHSWNVRFVVARSDGE